MADGQQDNQSPEWERALQEIDTSRRDVLRKRVIGPAVVGPAGMTFSVDGLLVSSARAANQVTLS